MNNEIISEFPSIVGYATKSYKDGEKAEILTQLNFFNMENKTDQEIITAKGQINSTLSEWIFPLVLKKFASQKLPENFLLYAVYIEMHSDEKKNKILINQDTHFRITCKPKPGLKFKKDDPVHINDIEKFVTIEKQDKDPNAATILLALNNGQWFGSFDLIYNRENVKEKCERAIEFFDSAIENYKRANYKAFYQSLWDCSELLAESLLLLHNQIKLKAPHSVIKETFKEFCDNYNLIYFENHKKISEIRNNSRYGPPHPKHEDSDREAVNFLNETYKFLKFVLGFLKERQVEPSNQKLEQINIEEIDTNKIT